MSPAWSPFTSRPELSGASRFKHLAEGDEDGKNWIPAEADVSIRPGWYYHAREDHQVHPLEKMVDIYYASVGRGYNLVYIDPPYRPLSGTAYFKEYSHNVFDDKEQEKLKDFCDVLTNRGCKIMQSNSNSLDDNGDSYFVKLYQGYHITQIEAHRHINAHVGKRKKQIELLIKNY